jgi:glycosyltransferase involved in cell wall biosynthesis
LIYVTRADLSWYSRNANAYQKPLLLAQGFDVALFHPEGTSVPAELARACKPVAVACGNVAGGWSVWKSLRFVLNSLRKAHALAGGSLRPEGVATGFDMPCLFIGWWLKRRFGFRWFVFCWDPPALSWRDRTDIVARAVVSGVDLFFRATVRQADRLVLNSHPGLLGEIGFRPPEGQLIPMRNGYVPPSAGHKGREVQPDVWRIGVLSNASSAKGVDLVLDAFLKIACALPRLRVVWVGAAAEAVRAACLARLKQAEVEPSRFALLGPAEHGEALSTLASCGVLVYPYLGVPSLKWNYALKVVEYMSLGRAVLAADTPGARDYITDGVNGLLFRAGEAADLAAKLSQIAGNGVEQVRLGQRAERDAERARWPEMNLSVVAKLQQR